MALTALFPLTRVARRLHVSGGELKKRCAAHHAAQSAPASTALDFVQVTATPGWPHPTERLELELHRADGTRLQIHAQASQCSLLAVIRTFLETA